MLNRLGDAQEAAGDLEECRKVCVACMQRFPDSEHIWKRFVILASFISLPVNKGVMPMTFLFPSLAIHLATLVFLECHVFLQIRSPGML